MPKAFHCAALPYGTGAYFESPLAGITGWAQLRAIHHVQ
jgi:hypothetical protein